MLKNIIFFLFVIFLILGLLACQSGPDLEQYEKEILTLHQEMIDAHLNKDADWFVKDIADDYFSVGRGEIKFPKPDETTARFRNYLNSTEFTKYNDLQEPIIKFSKDGSLAYLIVQVEVAGEQKIASDSIETYNTTWAWITLYEREKDKWIRLEEVSNHK